MPSRRWVRRLFTAGALALLSVTCSKESPVEPASLARVPPAALVVSDPFLPSQPLAVAAQGLSARRSLVSAAGDEVAYVSLPPGSLPKAISVTIRNVTTGAPQTPSIPFLNGGFDPIPVVARAGDELELRITGAAAGVLVYRAVVAKRRPPGVVRISPPHGRTDVPLNSQVMVVFTEPIAPATLTTATVQLLQGTAPVPGSLRLVAENLLAAEFVPDKELSSGTTYRLVVTRGIRDTQGDSLEAEVATDFTTLGATVPTPTFAGLVFSSISFGYAAHACGLEATTGLAYCWGSNHGGALGAGEVDGSVTPLLVSGARRFSSLSAGYFATCAIEAPSGFAYCWGGYYGDGDLGDGLTGSLVPTLVANGSIRFSSISASGGLTCGVESQSSLGYCWGKGGLTGDGTFSQRSTPTLVGSGSRRFSSITTSISGPRARVVEDASYACGLEAETGLAYCWGRNDLGQLGDGTLTDRLVPTLVGGGSLRFSSIDAGDLLTCGIEAQTGLVYCWGSNRFGQVGDGTTTDRPVPTLVDGGNRRFTSVDAGDMTCGIEAQTSAGYCWGRNNPVPTLVGGGSPRFSSIVAASYGSAFGLASVCAFGVEAQTGRAYSWDTQLIPTLLTSYPGCP